MVLRLGHDEGRFDEHHQAPSMPLGFHTLRRMKTRPQGRTQKPQNLTREVGPRVGPCHPWRPTLPKNYRKREVGPRPPASPGTGSLLAGSSGSWPSSFR